MSREIFELLEQRQILLIPCEDDVVELVSDLLLEQSEDSQRILSLPYHDFEGYENFRTVVDFGHVKEHFPNFKQEEVEKWLDLDEDQYRKFAGSTEWHSFSQGETFRRFAQLQKLVLHEIEEKIVELENPVLLISDILFEDYHFSNIIFDLAQRACRDTTMHRRIIILYHKHRQRNELKSRIFKEFLNIVNVSYGEYQPILPDLADLSARFSDLGLSSEDAKQMATDLTLSLEQEPSVQRNEFGSLVYDEKVIASVLSGLKDQIPEGLFQKLSSRSTSFRVEKELDKSLSKALLSCNLGYQVQYFLKNSANSPFKRHLISILRTYVAEEGLTEQCLKFSFDNNVPMEIGASYLPAWIEISDKKDDLSDLVNQLKMDINHLDISQWNDVVNNFLILQSTVRSEDLILWMRKEIYPHKNANSHQRALIDAMTALFGKNPEAKDAFLDFVRIERNKGYDFLRNESPI